MLHDNSRMPKRIGSRYRVITLEIYIQSTTNCSEPLPLHYTFKHCTSQKVFWRQKISNTVTRNREIAISNPRKALNSFPGTSFFHCLLNYSEVQTWRHSIMLLLNKGLNKPRSAICLCPSLTLPGWSMSTPVYFNRILQYAFVVHISWNWLYYL